MSMTYEKLIYQHPCFAQGKKSSKGRIHLPVSPGCNIACRFCERSVNDTEQRPGVTASVLSPEEAVSVVEESLKLCPEITVIGIAGPGDTLASSRALDTFRLIGQKFPQLIKCMSTNGLLLPEKADEIAAVGIDSLTVTVNSVNPDIEAQLNKKIYYHGKQYEGTEAAKILIRNQLAGIRAVTAAGVVVKVNTVLVPEINGSEIAQTAQAVSRAGARIYNIIPLIPQHELKNYAAPTCEQVDAARQQAAPYIDVFRHCQHCRADAIGVPGEKEYGRQVYGQKLYLKRLAAQETFSHG